MSEDARCCGSGTCIIDADGHCWCGQQWDGEKMGAAPAAAGLDSAAAAFHRRAAVEPAVGPSGATPPGAGESAA